MAVQSNPLEPTVPSPSGDAAPQRTSGDTVPQRTSGDTVPQRADGDTVPQRADGTDADALPQHKDPLEPRSVLLHRTVATITPKRIEIRPPKSTLVLPAIGIVVTSLLLVVLVVWTDSLPFWLLPVILLVSVVVLPLSGITLVYAIFGANIVADKAGQNVSVKQRYLGLGVGTTELVPFWKIRELVVEDVARAQSHPGGDEPALDIAQWDLTLVKKSGTRIRLGGYSIARDQEEAGLDIIMDVAEAFAALSGAPIRGPIW